MNRTGAVYILGQKCGRIKLGNLLSGLRICFWRMGINIFKIGLLPVDLDWLDLVHRRYTPTNFTFCSRLVLWLTATGFTFKWWSWLSFLSWFIPFQIVRTTTGIRANNLRYLTFVPLYSCCSFLLQPSQQRKLKGRLRLCARAIFFEPDYIKAPILMFPFSKITRIEQLVEPSPTTSTPTSKWKSRQEGFVLNTSMVIKMKEDGIDAPYVFEKKSSIWWFSLEFAPVQQVHQLFSDQHCCFLKLLLGL